MKQITSRSACPISYSLDLFGDKWTLLILRDIILDGKSSFSEFMSSSEKIASNILVDRLQILHTQGFLNKQASELNKSKFIYTLNDKAIDLIPVIIDLIEWGSKYNPTGEPKSILNKLGKNKAKTILELQKKFRASLELVVKK